MPANPLRILYNENNLLRTATLTPSSVEPAENTVLPIPASRKGTASLAITGAYTGFEDATVDVEIVDTTADTKRPSAPVLIGAGSETMTGISVTGFAAQTVRVALTDIGIPIINAAVAFEGVRLVAVTPGANGNNIHIAIDQGIDDSPPGLVFAPSIYSLLIDLKAGQGGPTTGLTNVGLDFGAAVLSVVDDVSIIPDTAPRIAFGDDRTVYLEYKEFVDGQWNYHFVPPLLRDIPAGTPVKIVTGGRTVTITDSTTSPATVETYTGIKTVYDILHAIREGSQLVTVDGIVANDRSPTGQASRDLLLRTDAHVEPSTGSGSRFATGFASTFADPSASTELVTARCFAVTAQDSPLAHVGRELWEVNGSLSGALADATTGVPYLTTKWGFTIPPKLPPGSSVAHGTFSFTVNYVGRGDGEREPPICVPGELGLAAIDQTITCTYKPRPPADCNCAGMAKPRFSATCLGTLSEDSAMQYTAAARTRLEDLYDFASTIAAAVTQYISGWAVDGIPETTKGPTDESGQKIAFSRSGRDGSGELSSSGDFTDSALVVPVDVAPVVTFFADFGLPADFQALIDAFELAIQVIDSLDDGVDKTAGWTKWDAALAAAIADLPEVRYNDVAVEKYKIMLRKAIAYAGISPLGKSDASALTSGDGCWQDYNDSAFWEVVGSVGGKYAPAFTNHIYYTSRPAGDGGKYYSTHEVGFEIQAACPQYLKFGDQVIIVIGNAALGATYQIGDTDQMAVVAGHDLYLDGGQDGNTIQTWNPTGSVDGPMPPYVLDTAAPVAYSSGGLVFTILQGGVPAKLGDEFRFACEGGHFQYRINGGGWIGPLDIPDGPLLLFDGLSVEFGSGSAPSFVVPDRYSFRVLQPRRASNLQAPGIEAWKWTGSAASMMFDLGSVQAIADFALALHTLPPGCTITVSGSDTLDSPWAPDWTETLTRVEGPIVAEFTGRSARYLLLAITVADGAEIGYAYGGPALTTELTADLDPMSRVYKMKRGSGGLYQGGRYLGKAAAGTLTWEKGWLSDVDAQALIRMVDYVKARGDQAIIVVTNIGRPSEAFMGQIASDQIDWPDLSRRQANANVERRFKMQLPVAGVYFQ